jgi:small conductance mechanosensitive channel
MSLGQEGSSSHGSASLRDMQMDRMVKARPHLIRAAISALLAIVGLVVAVSSDAQKPLNHIFNPKRFETADAIALAGAGAVIVFGIVAVRALVQAVKEATAHLGVARGTPVSFLASILGYAVVLIVALGALGLNPAGLLLGGAFTGIVLGIAAQQAFGNFIAGIVLLLVRPFTVGEHIYLRGSPIGGEYEGTVAEMSLFYVHLVTTHGPVLLPNAGVLASAVGPGARSVTPEEGEEEEEKKDDPPPAQGGAPTSAPPGT